MASMRLLSNSKFSKILQCVSKHRRAWYCQESQSSDSLANATNPKDLAKFYSGISKRYNLMNDMVILGMHRYWRKTLLNALNITDQSRVLDLAGGTGMNTFRILEKYKYFNSDSNFSITLFDLNPDMIKVAQNEMINLNYNPKFLHFVNGDIHELPFDNDSFDSIILFFAIRRQIDFSVVFKEVNRVLKPNGKFLICDFCYFQNPTLIQRLYCDYYIRYVAWTIERLIIGKMHSCLFLLKDIHSMLSKDQIQSLLEKANFQKIEHQLLSLGLASMTISRKA